MLFERVGSERYSRPALHGLDQRLEPYLPQNGFFVETGANDGYQHSNTYYLERFRGWTGILIEPIPELFEQCVRDRPGSRVYNYALVAEGGPTELTLRYHNLTSAVDSRDGSGPADESWDREYDVTVPARTLSSILDEAGSPAIDLLSLDVEGYEVEVLRGLARHAPRLILVEPNEADEDIDALLGDRYGRLAALPPNDVLYARRDGASTSPGSSASAAAGSDSPGRVAQPIRNQVSEASAYMAPFSQFPSMTSRRPATPNSIQLDVTE